MPNLKSLIQQNPSQRLAFVADADPDAIAEMLVAFANSEGGSLVLGIDATGRPGNILVDEDAAGALQTAGTLCNPPIITEWSQEETPEGIVVLLRVERSERLHTLDDGRVVVRSGRENRTLTGPEIHALAATKVSGDYEAELVPGSDRSDLDDDLIEYYLEQRRGRNPREVISKEKLLQQILAITPDGTPTVSGVLLFGQNPQAFLPHSRCVFVNFKHEQVADARSGAISYGRREEIGGPLAKIIGRTYDVILQEMEKSAVVRGLKRDEQHEYPPSVVREVLVNAVCHRDYKLSGRAIEVRMYDDRLEVTSPGGLPAYITVENIVDEHYSRNPRLVNGLFQWQYIEELGLGVDHMFAEMAANGLPPPSFEAKPHSFKVILFNNRDPMKAMAYGRQNQDLDMNERQIKAMQYIHSNGSISNGEYQTLCPYVGAESLRLDLVDLVNKGLLLKIGDKRGTRYILK